MRDGALLVQTLAVGLCGTDAEIVRADYGEAPRGEDHLVLGRENLGRVLTAPSGSGLAEGDLVVGIVRRRDPQLCPGGSSPASSLEKYADGLDRKRADVKVVCARLRRGRGELGDP